MFPTTTGGLEWFNKWDNGIDRILGDGVTDPYDPNFIYSCGDPNRNLHLNGDGVARFRSDVVCTSARFWVSGPWLNTEMTCQALKIGQMIDLQMRSRSNHDIGGMPHQCMFGNYAVNFNGKDGKTTMDVEVMHPIYKRYLVQKAMPDFPVQKYQGYKQVTRTYHGNKVNVEGYLNKVITDKDDWVKMVEFVFSGSNLHLKPTPEQEIFRKNCIDKGDKVANNLDKNTCWIKKGKRCWLRFNDCTSFNLRYFSIREINPL